MTMLLGESEGPELRKPDLILRILATEEQLNRFGVTIDGSKIIRRGKPGKVVGDTGTFPINDEIFDFSPSGAVKHMPASIQGQIQRRNLGITFGVEDRRPNNPYSFPDAISVALSYVKGKENPRPNMQGEYSSADHLRLDIEKKDKTRAVYYLEGDYHIY